MIQLELSLLPPHPKAWNLVGMVRAVMLEREWITLYDLQRIVNERFGQWHSDATYSARVRDLRKAQFGGYVVERRKRQGTNSFEYRIGGKP